MNKIFLLLTSLVLGGCATPDPRSSPSSETASNASAGTAPEQVTEVSIESFANVAVCRMEVPTGTRIAVERCYSREELEQTERDQASLDGLNHMLTRDECRRTSVC